MKTFHSFDERMFLRSVQEAIDQVSKIIDTEAHPVRLLAADETEHTYDDKFAVAESLTTTLQQAVGTILQESFGLQPEHQTLLDKWREMKSSITMRFTAKDSCTFLKENEVQVKDGTVMTEVKTTGGFLGGSSSTSRETTAYRTVKEYHWKVQAEYTLSVYESNNVDGGIILKKRTCETVLATQTKQTPLPATTVHPIVEASLTWFLNENFSIDRNTRKPITPLRNAQVEQAIKASNQLADFAASAMVFFVERLQGTIMDQDRPVLPRSSESKSTLAVGTTATIEGLAKEPKFNGQKVKIIKFAKNRYEVEPLDPSAGLPPTLALKANNLLPDQAPGNGPSLSTIQADTIVVPTLPLLEKEVSTAGSAALSEHGRSLRHAISDLEKWYPNPRLFKLITSQEAIMVLSMLHLETLMKRYRDGVAYIEATLRKQLVTAIGKEVNSQDFQSYMQYHYRSRLFGRKYQPTPFCRAIRRPDCFPDGTIALEQVIPGSTNSPVSTWVRESVEGSSFYVPIHAAASVELTGPKYLHGWMQHRFQHDASPTFQLACRARQFSSFLVILGTIAGPDTLEPQHAIVVQNKDELLIPLLADPLPSAKEFQDAIQSLSPEQQEFAKEFRSMQLSSSVFGVCVVQLKPQFEKLLGLPDKALTKEIQLTQDLMSLFVDYNVPSDMFTYDGPADATAADKVAAVKEHTQSVLSVIEENKKKHLKEEEMRATMRFEQAIEVPGQSLRAEAVEFDASAPDAPGGRIQNLMGRSRKMKKKVSAMAATASAPMMRRKAVRESCTLGGMGDAEDASANRATDNDPPLQFGGHGNSNSAGIDAEDFTLIPKILDGKLKRLDTDGALRSTTIKAGQIWTRKRQDNLLTDAKTSSVTERYIDAEKKKAFDLLDAISRSGALSIECSELHVIVAVSHCFENDVMGTVIEDNMNPISKVERSSLLLASTTFGVEAAKLLQNQRDVERLGASFPLLFGAIQDE